MAKRKNISPVFTIVLVIGAVLLVMILTGVFTSRSAYKPSENTEEYHLPCGRCPYGGECQHYKQYRMESKGAKPCKACV